MKKKEIKMIPNLVTPQDPVVFNEETCVGCNTCVQVCVMDILMPNPEKGKPPIVLYPDECYYDGLCMQHCPRRDKETIRINHPLNQRVRWKRKETGEHYRLGMPDPPPPNDRPPVSGWDARA